MKMTPPRDQVSVHYNSAERSKDGRTRGPVLLGRDQKPLRLRRSILPALLTTIALVLSACGSGSGSGGEPPKTIVFSSPSMSISAMKQMATGVKAKAESEGWKVVTQDPNQDAQEQARLLTTVVSSGTAGALWIVALSPSSLTSVLREAQDKGIPVFTNGRPEDYGFDGAQAGITFSAIDYEAYGTAVGEELGNCINEKLNGHAEVAWGQPVVGTGGKEEMQKAQEAALEATAPNAEIVSEIASGTLEAARTDIGNALQGHPGLNAVMGSVDEVALGAVSAFESAGRDLPCLVNAGGNEQVLKAVAAGKAYATVALQFDADIDQGFEALLTMRSDPKAKGDLLNIPQHITKAEG